MATASFSGTSFSFSSAMDVLNLVASGKVTQEQGAEMLNVLSPPRPQGKLSLAVSEKGCVSMYGLTTRFPISLYADQWERLIGMVDEIKGFISKNDAALPRKSESENVRAAKTAKAAAIAAARKAK